MLILAIYISLFIIGLKKATSRGFVLHEISETIKAILPYWMTEPLLSCVYCMSSVWGWSLGFLLHTFFGLDLGFWLFVLPLPVLGCTVVLMAGVEMAEVFKRKNKDD